MFSTYRGVLARPGAAAFSMSGALARFPMSTVGIAIVLMAQAVYDSYALGGRVSAAYVITHAVCSPQLAKLVDRHGQARVMRPAITAAAAGLVGLVVVGALALPSFWLYPAAVVTGAGIGSIGALVRARWSHLLTEPRDIHTAFSLEAVLDETVFVIGPILATLLATSVHPVGGLVLPFVALLVGGYLFLAQRATEPPPSRRPRRTGDRHVMLSAGMISIALVFLMVGAIFGAADVATIAFAREQGSPGAAGPVLAVFAAGSLVAGLAFGSRHWSGPMWRRFVIGIVVLAAGTATFVAVTNLVVLAVVMFVVGGSIAPTMITGNAMIREMVPAQQLTEGLTWAGTSMGIGVSLGSSVAGSWIDAVGSHGGFLVVVVAAGVGAVTALVAIKPLRSAGGAQVVEVLDAA